MYKGTKGYWIRRTASLNCLAPLGELGVASRLGIREWKRTLLNGNCRIL